MPIDSGTKPPKGKYSQAWFDAVYRHQTRLMALQLLKEKYQLSLHECQGVSPDVVRERQRLYDEHLARLRAVWRLEDEAADKNS